MLVRHADRHLPSSSDLAHAHTRSILPFRAWNICRILLPILNVVRWKIIVQAFMCAIPFFCNIQRIVSMHFVG